VAITSGLSRSLQRLSVFILCAAPALAACKSDAEASATTSAALPPATGTAASSAPAAPTPTSPATGAGGALAGVCPARIVVQTDWYATPERAAAYELAGPKGKVDKRKGSYTGTKEGVEVEVRLGGPFIGFQPMPAQMYQDPSIYLGYVATDQAVLAAEKFPTTAVVAPLEINPQILMWDPLTYSIAGWADVAKSHAKVLYVESMPFMDYLVAKGYVEKGQLDASFDGTPSRFVAEGGKLIQQGYASNEPFRWEHDVADWKKPVKFLLVHDSGYEIYPQGVAVRSGELEADKPCLAKLVPMLQRAQIDYANKPEATNETLVRVARELGDGPPITPAGNADAVLVMRRLGIVGTGANTTLGDFDLPRIERTIELLRPIFTARGDQVKVGLKAAELVSNEFIDPELSL
jgi:hypothetical protein